MLATALKARDILLSKNIKLEVASLKTIKPLDEKTLKRLIKLKNTIFTLENHVSRGGIGEIIQNKVL